MTTADILKGVIPVILTPFDAQDRIDEAALAAEVEAMVAGGVQTLSTGLISEVMALNEAERVVLLKTIAAAAKGRAGLIAASGGETAQDAIRRGQAAIDLGFDVLLVTPPGGLTDEDALYAYYAALSDAVAAPILVQDAAPNTGVRFSAPLLERMAAGIEHVVAVKVETPPTPPRFDELAPLVGKAILLGGRNGPHVIDEWRRGAVGTMGTPWSALLFHLDLWRELEAGDVPAAMKRLHRYNPVFHWAYQSASRFLYLEKEMLRRRGIFGTASMRAPHKPLSDLELREMEELLEFTGAA